MKGLLLAILGAWLSGLAIPGIKLFLVDVTPFNLIVISNIGAIVCILIAKKILRPGFVRLKKDEWGPLLLGLFLGSGLAVPLAIIGMVTVSGSVSGMLFNLEMFFTFYLAYFFFQEKLGLKTHLAMWCVFIGGIVSALGGPIAGELKGMVLIMISCLFFALQTNVFKKVKSQDSFSMTVIEFAATLTVALIFSQVLKDPFPDLNKGIQLLFLGVLTYAFGNVLFFRSLKRIGAARTATVFGTAPLLGALSSFVILGDPITLTILIGIGMVGLGLVFLFLS